MSKKKKFAVNQLKGLEKREALRALAKKLAGDNDAKRTVLTCAYAYEEGMDIDFHEEDGIKFASVGHNASHEFYLGYTEDGKLYRMSYCSDPCDCDDGDFNFDDNCPHCHGLGFIAQTDIVEITDGDIGYVGHF